MVRGHVKEEIQGQIYTYPFFIAGICCPFRRETFQPNASLCVDMIHPASYAKHT